MMHRALCRLLLGVAPVALLATPVMAQEAGGPTAQSAAPSGAVNAAPAADNGQLAEVVVTATRQEQNLQKVSTAVKVIGGDVITKQGLSNISQVLQDLPSVQATGQPGGFSVDVRGLGGDLPAGSTQGSIAVVFDGVYNINSQGTTVGFFDVNRIEVLPGPQSTRYGPNADGGVVNVITNDPVLGRFTGQGSMTVGNYSLFRGEAAVNIPIGDKFALRLSGAGIGRDSYFTPAEGAQQAESFRAKLLFQPTDSLRLKLEYQLDHIGGEGNGSNVFPMFTNKVPVYSGDSINQLDDPWAQSPSNPVNETSANIYQHTLLGNVGYQFNNLFALDMLGSYSRVTGGNKGCIYLPPWSTDASNGPVICGANLQEFDPFYQYTAEVRLHSTPGSRITWDLGYYHWNYTWQYALSDAAFLSSPPVKTATSTNALYGEVTYPITDALRLIGGLRQSWDDRSFNFNNAGTVTSTYGIGFSHFDYRAGVEYDVAPRSMLYATVATGYRPGGLSAFNPVTNAPNSFESEVNTAFEFGSKNRFLDNRLQLNADVFYYRTSNYQNLDKYTGFIPPEGGGPCNNGDTRAGCQTPTFGVKAQSLGVEGQLVASVTSSDVVRLTGVWLDAKFDKNQATCATVAAPTTPGCWDGYNSETPNDPGAPFFFNLAGAVQPHSPTFSATMAYQHTFRFTSGATLALGGDAFYTTGYWVNPVHDADFYGYQPAYWLENVSATFTAANGRWSLTGFARNLSNYAVKASVLPATSIGEPLTFGATVGVNW